jgi:small nuclear ribonucleoprotein (snRNP)-like protein
VCAPVLDRFMEVADPDDGASRLDVNSLLQHSAESVYRDTPERRRYVFSRNYRPLQLIANFVWDIVRINIKRNQEYAARLVGYDFHTSPWLQSLRTQLQGGARVRDSEGRLVYETEYDSHLLMFPLKSYDRKRFGDKIENTFGPNWEGSIEDLPEEFLRQVLAKLDAQAAAIAAKEHQALLEAPAASQTVDVKPQPPSPGGQS